MNYEAVLGVTVGISIRKKNNKQIIHSEQKGIALHLP